MAYHLEKDEVCPSSPKKDRNMTMVIFILSPLESCEVIMACLLDKEEVCPSSPKNERSMTMVIFILSPIKSCGGDHGISSR